MELGKYSFGLGDRFGLQGKALLRAIIEASALGVQLTPVWNKSYREHLVVGSTPADTRREADEAVRELGWQGPYFVDADHISRQSVELFIQCSDFFTLDVAEHLGKEPDSATLANFVQRHAHWTGMLEIPGTGEPFKVDLERLQQIGRRYLVALEEAESLYKLILNQRDRSQFLLELSMDEAMEPQDPVELFFILGEVAHRGMPISTLAPKFVGRLHKGVDYQGKVEAFAENLAQAVAVVKFAIREFSLPRGLKLSLHSGSDKFSLYGAIKAVLRQTDAGFHIKTAGTTWLEEVSGLVQVGGEGLSMAKVIYRQAYRRWKELVAPYKAVVDIRPQKLPRPEEVDKWDEDQFIAALEHDPDNSRFRRDLRQLMHVAYKIAAEMGSRYVELVLKHEDTISRRVTRNILDRHIRPLFMEIDK